ncbi:MAG: phosphate acyltransferase PlsX [Caldilineaceae bacterium]
MNIALDVMGGDFAPQEIVAGAVLAAREYGITVSLVGKPGAIEQELAKHDVSGLSLPIVPASEVIEMHDKPAQAVRNKKDSSMAVACRLVKSGEAQAFVTAGNTGGALAAGILHIGRMKGIHRPALITPFPTQNGFCTLLDVGANADVKPENLQQFAVMGTIYAKRIMNIANPSVRILSNGEEQGKGSQLVIETAQLLERTPGVNFQGNIEGRDVMTGAADVIITDGFTGNVLIKTAEGMVKLFRSVLTEELKASPVTAVGGLLSRPAFNRMARRLDDSEFGGAILMGLSSVLVVGHGKSNANATRHAIRVAKQSIELKMIEEVQHGIHEVNESAALPAGVTQEP